MLKVAAPARETETQEYLVLTQGILKDGMMRVTLKSAYLDVAHALFGQMLEERGWNGAYEPPALARNRFNIVGVYVFKSDAYKPDIRAWAVHAAGCDLLTGFEIEAF